MGWGQEKSTMPSYVGSARNTMRIRVWPLVIALCCQPGPCPVTVGRPGSPHTAWQWWVPDYAEFIPAGCMYERVRTWYLVTCSDISTVLHGTQGPWAITPLSGLSSPGPSPLHSKEAIVLPFGFPPWRRDIIPYPQGTSALKQELICFHLPLSWFT